MFNHSRKRTHFLSAVAASLLFIASAHATSTGLSADPMGSAWSRLDPNTAFATWDNFESTSFSGETPDSSFGINNPGLSQTSPFTVFNQGGGLYNVATSSPTASNGDVLFGGGNTVSFSITGQVQFTIYGLVLQIKRPASTAGLNDSSGFTPTLSIDGSPAIAANAVTVTSGSGDTSSTAGTYSVTTWYWGASLAGDANTGNDTFTVNFSKAASQRLLDGMTVDVANVPAVPEPSPAWLGLIGTGAFAAFSRRRASALQPALARSSHA